MAVATLHRSHTLAALPTDYDNDGFQDMAVVNFAVRPFTPLHATGPLYMLLTCCHHVPHQGNVELYHNNAGDVALHSHDDAAHLRTHWLRVRVREGVHGRDSLGAIVTLHEVEEFNVPQQVREVRSVTGFQGSSETVVHFGLGSLAAQDASAPQPTLALTVHWPARNATLHVSQVWDAAVHTMACDHACVGVGVGVTDRCDTCLCVLCRPGAARHGD